MVEIETGIEYQTKLLVAVGAHTQAVLLDFDGDAARYEVEATDNNIEDWGLEPPGDAGLWAWEGAVFYPPDDAAGDGYEPDFTGSWRRATAEEAIRFAAGERVWV
jgi:hypothetical protein